MDNNPDRTLLYVSTDPAIPLFGHKGSSTHVREMARAFADLGWEVWMATSGPVASISPGYPCRVERLPGLRGRGWRWLGFDGRLRLGAGLSVRRLKDLVTRLRPRFIYERYSLYGVAGEELARRRGLPRILEVNAVLSEESSTRLHFARWARRVEAGLFRGAGAVAAISSVMKQRLIEGFGVSPERVFISPMGIDPQRFHPGVAPREEVLRVRAEAGPSCSLIGYVGSFNTYHRPDWLLDLAAALSSSGMSARIVVIGGPRAKADRHREEAARRGLSGWFHYAGERPHEELPGWLAGMDMTVVPGAAAQSSPTKIVEAAAIGLPQVMPDTLPIRHLAGEVGEWAFFPPEDREIFIRRVLEGLGRAGELRKRCRACSAQTALLHSWKRRAGEVLERFERLAASDSHMHMR